MTGKEYIISELEKASKGKKSDIVNRHCPGWFGLKEFEGEKCMCEESCAECWKQALESEVKK